MFFQLKKKKDFINVKQFLDNEFSIHSKRWKLNIDL